MSTADLFKSVACKAMQAAKEASEPKEQFVLLKLALEWAAAAQRDEAARPQGRAALESQASMSGAQAPRLRSPRHDQ